MRVSEEWIVMPEIQGWMEGLNVDEVGANSQHCRKAKNLSENMDSISLGI